MSGAGESPGVRVLFSPDAFVQRAGGVTRYVARLHAELRRLGVPSTIVAGLHWNEHVAAVDGAVGLRLPARSRRGPLVDVAGAANRALTGLALRRRPDAVLHATYYTAPVPKGVRPSVVTVYDMIHELFPGTLPASEGGVAAAKRRWCRRATAIIALSERTKADLVQHYGVEDDRISVVYPGVDGARPLGEDPPWPRPYVLYVGSRTGYKNFDRLLDAFGETRAHEELDLLVFGGEPLTAAEWDAAERRGVRLHRATGSDVALAAHYEHAHALVYPSLYEGFGFPPLEAMTYRCPVACSASGSIPEVVGDAAAQFDPNDRHDMARVIDRVCFDDRLRRELQARGETRAARYRWDDAARATIRLYEQVAGGRRGPAVSKAGRR